MINKIKEKLSKSVIYYLIFGVLTTVINLIIFYCCHNLLNINELVANIIAWIVAVIFAFVTNKYIVFESKSNESKTFFKELTSFLTARLLTLGLEEVMILLFITILGFNATLVKLTAQFLVIVFNYVLSKIFVFKKSL